MADGPLKWEREHIPDEDFLFRRVHESFLDEDDPDFIPPAIFRESKGNGGVSVDWNKYSTSNDARNRAREPERNGIIEISAISIRDVENLEVNHVPIFNNRAHSNIVGLNGLSKQKRTKARWRLAQASSWVIKT
ncbi:MAG: hypothetical protein ACFFCS_29835 [Candidatus Hodarchaeota archaeon]